MTTEKIILRHTISKQAYSYPADYARDLLADPQLGQYLEEVNSEKPEVLGGARKARKAKDAPATLSEEQLAQLSAGETVTTKADVVVPADKDKD